MTSERNDKGQFRKLYMNSEKEVRDRFQVEFNKEERDMFTDMQMFMEQSKDATNIKQWAFYAWLTISNHKQSMVYLKEKLLINTMNNKRLGIDVRSEIENKFQQNLNKFGGNL